MISYKERVKYNTQFKTYGKMIKLKNPIPKKHRFKFVVGCVVTPFTNWLIPLILINEIKIRY